MTALPPGSPGLHVAGWTALTLAATDGSLLARVRRVLRQHSNETQSPAATIAATLALLIAILTAGVPRLSASIQSANTRTPVPVSAPLAFEAASVKPDAAGPTAAQRGMILPGERVTLVNYPLRTIVQMAYALTTAQEIAGAPGWIASERFDITAKAEAPSSADQLRAMLRTLLADRFKLAAHPETRNTPVYALVVARSDGRLGPQLHLEAKDCESLRVIARAQPGTPDPCATPPKDGPRLETQFGHYSQRSRPIDLLATILRLDVDRPIVNKTGLTGSYDWDLTWTPQRFLQNPFDHDQFPTVDPSGPTIFTAVQEQLGLKLEPTTGADPVLVIDHVEHPTAD